MKRLLPTCERSFECINRHIIEKVEITAARVYDGPPASAPHFNYCSAANAEGNASRSHPRAWAIGGKAEEAARGRISAARVAVLAWMPKVFHTSSQSRILMGKKCTKQHKVAVIVIICALDHLNYLWMFKYSNFKIMYSKESVHF